MSFLQTPVEIDKISDLNNRNDSNDEKLPDYIEYLVVDDDLVKYYIYFVYKCYLNNELLLFNFRKKILKSFVQR